MNGLLILNKKRGMSSHDCVNHVRLSLDTRKVGHAGTLDVEASGVLVLGVNKGTRIMQYLDQDDKSYEFTVAFNEETDTLDHTGKTIKSVDFHDFEKLDSVLEAFTGDYMQTPPIYSAIKIKGKKLYEYARKDEPIPELTPRKTTIYELRRLSPLMKRGSLYEADFFVKGTKGLYVRKLALDIAKTLGTLAHTTKIHRTRSGVFTIDDAHDIEDLKEGNFRLLGLNEALPNFPAVIADETTVRRIRYGQEIRSPATEPLIKLVDEEKNLLAIYKKAEGDLYRADKVFL